MRSIVVGIFLVAGCETGTEIAGVSSVTVDRSAEGRVVVTATLDCMLAKGMPRGDGKCDADDTQVCVKASWFSADKPPSRPVLNAQVCQTVAHIRGATVQLPFSKLPGDAKSVLVMTSDQDRARNPAEQRGVVAREH